MIYDLLRLIMKTGILAGICFAIIGKYTYAMITGGIGIAALIIGGLWTRAVWQAQGRYK